MLKYFKESEFECKCGCGLNNVSHELKTIVDEMRERLGRPVMINSGSRCVKHNASVGGSPTSSHIDGFALDVRVSGSLERFEVVKIAIELGINRIGVANGFVHLDNHPYKIEEILYKY